MLATFQNRLQIIETPYESPRVTYTHGRRLKVKVFIDYVPSPPQSSNRDWHIALEGDKPTIDECKAMITREIRAYFKQRTHQDMAALPFTRILAMAEMPTLE